MLAHERCGAQLYRSVSPADSPVLRERYDRFGNETVEHVETTPDDDVGPLVAWRDRIKGLFD
jgi:hypothetical protein